MGTLYDMKLKIEAEIEKRGMDVSEAGGKIALQTGFLLAFINERTPDEQVKIEKLRAAAEKVLGITI